MANLRYKVAEYEALKAHQVSALELHSLSELPDLLIKARIAHGYTQAELAKRLHLKPQQLQRYEATRYHSVSFRRLLKIARALDVALSETVRLTRSARRSVDTLCWHNAMALHPS